MTSEQGNGISQLRGELEDLLQRNAGFLSTEDQGSTGIVTRYTLVAEITNAEDVRTLAVFSNKGLSAWDFTGMLTHALRCS